MTPVVKLPVTQSRVTVSVAPPIAAPVTSAPVAEAAAFPQMLSCPVATTTAEPRAGSGASLDVVPRWSRPDDGLSAAGSLLVSAERFITQFYSENQLGSPDERLRVIRWEIESSGTYWHTADELAFGARVAWRNSSRCIGRLYWKSLRVRDCREVTAAADIAAESVLHLRDATNGGRIRPVITIFAPDAPGRPGPRILNSQLVRYAGYQRSDGTVIGDPANVELTRLARQLGWAGGLPAGRFDMLPLLVQEPGAPVTVHSIPADAVLEVTMEHPEFAWFADLGLRWYAVPAICDTYLEIGGVSYPAAPFNGWYMCTEIGSRDLGDSDRYDQLPVIAARMGLSVASDRSLWKDKALTELNLAVLHSFAAAGITITDHHTESVRFLQHIEREARHGRACPADWTWIVPPAASSATPVFHRYYQDFDQTPNFYRHPVHASLGSVGVGPVRGHGPSDLGTARDREPVSRGGADGHDAHQRIGSRYILDGSRDLDDPRRLGDPRGLDDPGEARLRPGDVQWARLSA
jgi:nitric-oxide synthase